MGRNFFWDHFLKELRHQAQLGNQAFWYLTILPSPPPTGRSAIGGGRGRKHFCYLREKKQMGSYLLTLFFFNFRVKEYYLISLRSVQIRIFCLWLKHASSWILNTTHDQMEPKGISNQGNTCLWIVSYKLCSRWCVFPKDSLDCSTIARSAPHRVQVLKMYSILKKSQQANNINLSVNCVIEPSTFFNGIQNLS